MRSINSNAIAKVLQTKGTEPINIVEINWAGTVYKYADKTFDSFGQGLIFGKILELANLENVINITKSGSSQSVGIMLDDSDGTIKQIYNVNDIQKRPVKIYQWFTGLNYNDKFLIFEGEINSPIEWNEGDRTFRFEIVSKLEDKEVGFSPEEGSFSEIQDELIGKPWPLPFGTCLKIPCIRLDPIPQGVTLDHSAKVDDSIINQIFALFRGMEEAKASAYQMFLLALEEYHTGMEEGKLSVNVGGGILGSVESGAQSRGDAYTARGNEYLHQAWQMQQDSINLQITHSQQKAQVKKEIQTFFSGRLPPGIMSMNLPTELGLLYHEGFLDSDNVFHINKIEQLGSGQSLPQVALQSTTVVSGGQTVVQKGNFLWVNPGQTIFRNESMSVRYIVAMIPVTVIGVYARRTFGGGARFMFPLPPSYYTVTFEGFGSITATEVVLVHPLSYRNEGWEDEIFVDVVSPIGPNTVNIMTWIIQHYTTLSIDAASFNHVRSRINAFPSNFCLFDRKNIVELLNEIAFQARCALWIKENTFYIRYLVDEPAPIETISESDVIQQSLTLEHTPTEDLVTKLVASYKTQYSQDKPFKIILRNNVRKYGTLTKDYDWYIYNNPRLVDLAATFWLIRMSNTWKILKFKTPLHKLKVETLDIITINFASNFACYGPMNGEVQSCTLDSKDFELSLSVWLPVRIGEMTKYNFAWPIDSEVRIYPSKIDSPGGGGPGVNSKGSLASKNGARPPLPQITLEQGKRFKMDNGHWNPGTQNIDSSIILDTQIGNLDSSRRPGFDYNYRNYNLEALNLDTNKDMGTYPAKIEGGEGPEYTLAVFTKGIDKAPVVSSAKNVDHKEGDKLSVGTWVMMSVVIWGEPDPDPAKPVKLKTANYFSPGGGTSTFPGRVMSGSGSTYNMAVYTGGMGAEPINVPDVKQLQIALNETVPEGTWALVAKGKDGKYTMQVPVWLE